MERLFPREQDALRFIGDWINLHHYPPSVTRLAEGLQLGRPQTIELVRVLERKGYLVVENAALVVP